MRMFYRLKIVVLVVVLMSVLFSACGKSSDKISDNAKYASFRDVPGVTEDEIEAIEALKRQRASFICGMLPSTEAFVSQSGTINGYSPLFCAWLTEFFEIPFRVKLYSWSDILAGLESFEIDFAGDLTATEERLKKYYMTTPIATRPLKYVRLSEARPYQEILRSRPLRFAFLRDSVIINQITSNFEPGSFEYVLVEDASFIYDLLVSGEADTYFLESTEEAVFDLYDDLNFSDFLPAIIGRVSLTTQNPVLRPIISIVQKVLQNSDGHFLAQMYNRGNQEYLKNKLFLRLTDEEKNYIKTNPVVAFAAETENYPVSFYNPQENQWQGIVFDIFEEIQSYTGLKLEVVNNRNTNWYNLLKMLEDGKASMISELIQSEERKGRFLWPES